MPAARRPSSSARTSKRPLREAPTDAPGLARIVALEGPSGAGKTTLSRKLATEWNALLIEEAYDRLRPAPSLAFSTPEDLLRLEQRLLAEESLRFLEARTAFREGRLVLMDTGPLGPLQYTAGLVRTGWPVQSVLGSLGREVRGLVHRGRLGLPDVEIYLDALPHVALARSQRRSPRLEEEFLDRHAAVDAALRPLWRGSWKSLLQSRLVLIPADGTVDNMAERVGRSLREAPAPNPASDVTTLDWIRSLTQSRGA